MATRICELCYSFFATSSELIAHYQVDHKDDSDD
jgi:hypothetical protein